MLRTVLAALFLTSTASAIEVNPYGACPGQTSFRVFGSPNGRIAVATGTPGGAAVVPVGQPCAGTRLSIGNPTLQQVVTLNANGMYETALNLPAAACGLAVQGLDLATCQVSLAQPL